MIDAWIAVSAARHAALTAATQPIPNPIQIRALIDTGATSTCMDPSVLQALNLTPTGSATVETPSTGGIPVSADQYDIGLIVPAGDK
jgi:predicted aspartyl protease